MLTITSRIPITATIRIIIGDDFYPSVTWKDAVTKEPIDFTGCQAILAASFRDGTGLILSTLNGGIDLVTTPSAMSFYLAKEATSVLLTKEGTFNLWVTDSLGKTSTWLKGQIYVVE